MPFCEWAKGTQDLSNERAEGERVSDSCYVQQQHALAGGVHVNSSLVQSISSSVHLLCHILTASVQPGVAC